MLAKVNSFFWIDKHKKSYYNNVKKMNGDQYFSAREEGLYVFDSIISSILQSNTFRDKAIVLFNVIMHYIMLQTESISSECFIMVIFTRVVIKSVCVN